MEVCVISSHGICPQEANKVAEFDGPIAPLFLIFLGIVFESRALPIHRLPSDPLTLF